MELRLLQAFVVAAREATFSEAAAHLSITQPALTKQIQQIESLLGTSLFRRGRHGSALTAAGKTLLADAQQIVELSSRFDLRARRIAAGYEGHLSIGFGLSSISVAPRVVAAFRTKSPNVTVRLEDLSSAVQIEKLRTGGLDVAFTRLPIPADLESVPVLSDRLAVACPAGWDAPHDDETLAGWLAKHALVRLSASRGPGLAAQTGRYFAHLGVQPATIQDADDLQTVLALIAAGVGAGVVPESARIIAPARVEMLPLGGRHAAWKIGVAWKRTNETPVVRAFLSELSAL